MPTIRPLQYLRAVLNGFSQIVLQAHPGCGLLVLLALGLQAPTLMIGAMFGVLVATLGAAARGYRPCDIEIGLYGYNAALIGVLCVWLLGLSVFSLGLVAFGSMISNPLQARLLAAVRERNGLPGFTLPFILFGWSVLASVDAPELATPNWLDVPLRIDGLGLLLATACGIGQILFLGQPLAGLSLLIAVWLADRRAAGWMVCGSAAGVALGLAAGADEQQVLAGLSGYNPALAAIAVSQVQRSPWAPLLAILAAVLIKPAFDRLGLPALTLPFILACWLVALGSRWYRLARA